MGWEATGPLMRFYDDSSQLRPGWSADVASWQEIVGEDRDWLAEQWELAGGFNYIRTDPPVVDTSWLTTEPVERMSWAWPLFVVLVGLAISAGCGLLGKIAGW